ncbi:MAG: T9SS type A sorting domain-containing protein [Flavobacteriales bacterium]|nr:T9SS type A sorting domain-containing protein [Flavobacteriales bacterium]
MMRKHKLKNVLVIFFLVGSVVLHAQNYIYNSGFETGDHSGAAGVGTSGNLTTDYISNWERANSDCYHSPDWWRKYAPSNNFSMYNVAITDDAWASAPGSTIPFNYSEIVAHEGYAMMGMGRYELIQQKYNHNGLTDALDNSPWTTITLKFWMRASNKVPLENNTELKVYLAKKKVKYKTNNPDGMHYQGHIIDCNSEFCDDNYRKYKSNTMYEILTIPSSAFGTVYPRGEWHQVVHTFVAPSNINKLDWLVFDLHASGSIGSNPCQDGGYLFLDDMQMLVGCDDDCSRTDGPITSVVLGNTINATNAFSMALPGLPGSPLPLSNINKLRLEVFANNGAITVFDKTVECLNGLDHVLYWDGTNAGGSPLANAIYQYRITVYNDCGQQQFTGSLLKVTDYAGPNVTNFDEPCYNGINLTPEPCCYEDIYENNKTLIGVDPGWSEFIVARNIWACTAQPDFSDEVVVQNGAQVLYRAGKQITLAEGFHTDKGAVFLAEIKPCNRDGGGANGKLANFGTGIYIYEEDDPDADTEGLIFTATVHPNPSNTGKFILEMEDHSEESYVEVLNIMGTLIQSKRIGGESKTTIDVSEFPKGIYLIRIVDGEHSETKKVIFN